MFKWLERRAAAQCKINIRFNTRILATVADDAHKNIVASGGGINEADIARVKSCQQSLLIDVQLGVANGLTLEEIQAESDAALVGEAHSEGTRMAIAHVMNAAAKVK